MQIEITHTANHSQCKLNKNSGVPGKQYSLSKSNIIFRENPGSSTLPESIAYHGQGNKWEVLPRHCYKERRILLINNVAFF